MMAGMDLPSPGYERIDLHTHSRCSDGALDAPELVALAALRGVQLLALTDHDTLEGCASASRACAERNIEFLHGCELTASWRGREIHIVGLRLDPQDPTLHAHLAGVRAQRIERVRAIGERLGRAGAPGQEIADEVLARPGTPTRLHLAAALVARGLAKDIDDAFKRWLGTGARAGVSVAFPPVEAALAAIRAAGGVAVLAHPQRYKLSGGGLKELCRAFRELGGEGIEVSLPGLSPAAAARAASLARRFDLAGSVGSDFHAPGLAWRPVGRFAKLPEGVVPITERLGLSGPGTAATAPHARSAT